ncbi:hypothetical protein ASF06_18465 [Agreia sp. Leaf244]|uniref:hypothetical protein n=1 Tax=Agreia sp. Leaf244 TaxID=1736305 RepID=UPI0006F37AD9|nr:hypothetical protein [Agreia sp. Leaf244]KQO05032.1 hypothetical protein ASF06_18465 [Agreia sp. Leaf244]
MFLKKTARSSESKQEKWGPSVIYLGIGVAALSLIVIWWSAISESEPAAGRPATLMIFGIPAGLVLIIIGAVRTFRDQRRNADH